MHGWRARLGVIVPSCNVILEPELYKMVPEGISVHFARARILEDTPEELQKMVDDAPNAAQKLAHAKVNAIAFGCTGASLFKGLGFDLQIAKKIEDTTGIAATTTSTAVVAALKELGIKKVSVATAYEEWLNEKEKEFLEKNGFKVLNIKGLGIPDPEELARVHPEVAYELAREVDKEEADGIFISCTDFRTIEILEVLEHDSGKPVVSSNQATLWMLLKLAGIRKPIEGYGRLLREKLN